MHAKAAASAPAAAALHYCMSIHLPGGTVNFPSQSRKEQQMTEQTALAQLAAAMGDEPALLQCMRHDLLLYIQVSGGKSHAS
ncbi:hypothetical protein CRX72_12330 [Pantoea sp. BRM17]|nr:hypothetical protein CRX72_12330 [Pantoea sp. BRM17]